MSSCQRFGLIVVLCLVAVGLVGSSAWRALPSAEDEASRVTLGSCTSAERDKALFAEAARLKTIIEHSPDPTHPPVFCFAPGTPPETIERLGQLVPELNPETRYQFNDGNRWGGAGLQGTHKSLTWSFVPDGLTVDGGSSALFSIMDTKFGGNRSVWISKFQACFDRWSQLIGVSYTHVTDISVDSDDGAAWGSAGAARRGDVRIASIGVDGAFNILAYNQFPDNGDMVLDAAEDWGDSANDYRFFRNVVMHEHGHGLGFQHICPLLGARLMEPIAATGFDGPQHDEMRAGQRAYGDIYEPNDAAAQATDLGTLASGVSATIGPVPLPSVANGSLLSIDATSDVDWFKFTVPTPNPNQVSINVSPRGANYDDSPQACSGQPSSCCSGNFTNSLTIADLNVQLVDRDGVTVLATAAAQPAGSDENLVNVTLPGGAGTFYVRVYSNSSFSQSQLYRLQVTYNFLGDLTPPSPNPMTFASPPAATGSSSIAMTATTASDPLPPVQYFFEFVSGGPGGDSSGWQASTSYTDIGLSPDRFYTYRVKARDGQSPPNEGGYSAPTAALTQSNVPGAPILSSPTSSSMVLDVNPNGNPSTTDFSIGCDSTNPYDPNWEGLNVDASGNPTDQGDVWQSDAAWGALTLHGMQPNTEYVFFMRARNQTQLETNPGPSASLSTLAPSSCNLQGDVNNDSTLDGRDIAGYVRVKMGTPGPGDIADCANYGHNDIVLDTADFAADLLN